MKWKPMPLPKPPYGELCSYCMEPATTWDHVHPRCRGGTEAEDNLVPACLTCNTRKQTQQLIIFLLRRRWQMDTRQTRRRTDRREWKGPRPPTERHQVVSALWDEGLTAKDIRVRLGEGVTVSQVNRLLRETGRIPPVASTDLVAGAVRHFLR